MELRLAIGTPRPDRPAVIRLRDGLSIGRHPKPIPKPGDEGPCSCTPGCKFCEEKSYADVRLGDQSSLPGLIGRLHARVAFDDHGVLWLHHLSELGRTRVGDKMLKANKSQALTEEYRYVVFTVVVKLTPDEEDEPPSAMRVVGASRHFHYGPAAGDAVTSQ